MKNVDEMNNNVVGNLLITGGFGNVACVFLQLLNEHQEKENFETIYIMDYCESDYAQKIINKLPDLNIIHLQQDYSRDLDYFLLDNNITSVVHLVAESSQPIWRAIKKVQQKTSKIITYVDASMYVSTYNSKLDNPKYRLFSNFELFDSELKGKYENDIIGITSTGANPYILTDCLAHAVVYGGLEGIPENGFGKNGLKGLYCIEKDRVGSNTPWKENEIRVSWQPFACVEEMSMEPANYFNNEECFMSPNKVASQVNIEFSFGDGDIVNDATAVIHEEVRMMCKRYGVEGSFLYSVPPKLREKVKLVEEGKNAHDFTYNTLSPLVDTTISGTDKLGMLCIYEDKEIAIFNESGNFGFSSGVSYQVGVGVYTPWLVLNDMVRAGKAKELHLDWAGDKMDIPEFKEKQLSLLTKYLNIEINITTTNNYKLIKDRIKEKDVEWICVNPKVKLFSDEDFEKEYYTYEDIYTEYIYETLLESTSDTQAIISYLFSCRFLDLKTETEEEYYEWIVDDFKKYITTHYVKNFIPNGVVTLDKIYICDIETMLLHEDIAEKSEIINFMVKHLSQLRHVQYKDDEELFQAAYNLFKIVYR